MTKKDIEENFPNIYDFFKLFPEKHIFWKEIINNISRQEIYKDDGLWVSHLFDLDGYLKETVELKAREILQRKFLKAQNLYSISDYEVELIAAWLYNDLEPRCLDDRTESKPDILLQDKNVYLEVTRMSSVSDFGDVETVCEYKKGIGKGMRDISSLIDKDLKTLRGKLISKTRQFNSVLSGIKCFMIFYSRYAARNASKIEDWFKKCIVDDVNFEKIDGIVFVPVIIDGPIQSFVFPRSSKDLSFLGRIKDRLFLNKKIRK